MTSQTSLSQAVTRMGAGVGSPDLRTSPMHDLPTVSVVVVHWANIADTVECLASLSAVDYPRLSVVLVNNGSRDFDEEPVRQAFKPLVIIESPTNLGFAGGSNLGIMKALDDGHELVFLLNNDAVVRPDVIR